MQKLDCVLLIDDDDITNMLHQVILKKLNITHELLIAQNGQIALDIIQGRCEKNLKCPELILLDINMPVMNGFEFLEAYEKKDIKNKDSIIIMMLTTSVNQRDIERAKHPYITRFLNKPITEKIIKNILVENFKWEIQESK